MSNADTDKSPPEKANLLLVDDEPNILKSLRRVFRSNRYNVRTAESGINALEILKEHSIDLIISDMRMPGMDGAEFLAHAAEDWPETIRILLTGFADMESTIAAVNQGKIFSYCCKPWEDDDLLLRVNQGLEQKWLREESKRLTEIVKQQNIELKELNSSLEDKVEQRTAELKQSMVRLDQANNELKQQYTESIKAFAKIIEMRPGIGSGHSLFIAENARKVSIRLNQEAGQSRDILYAGLLWQLGKMSLPDTILNLPFYELNVQQKSQFLNHAKEGRQLLMGIKPLKNAADIIHHQYEHYNGKGFPSGLVGTDIPIGSRILAVIRDYLGYMEGTLSGNKTNDKQIKEHLIKCKETEYDPIVVDTFLQILAESEEEKPIVEISWNQLKPGMEAAEIVCNDILFLKDQILTQKNVDYIRRLREKGAQLSLKIRLGNMSPPELTGDFSI